MRVDCSPYLLLFFMFIVNCLSISVYGQIKQFGSYIPMSLLWKACWAILVLMGVAALMFIFVVIHAVL